MTRPRTAFENWQARHQGSAQSATKSPLSLGKGTEPNTLDFRPQRVHENPPVTGGVANPGPKAHIPQKEQPDQVSSTAMESVDTFPESPPESKASPVAVAKEAVVPVSPKPVSPKPTIPVTAPVPPVS